MKIFRSQGMEKIELETNDRPIRIEINGCAFDIAERYGNLFINQIEGSMKIIPHVSNVIQIECSEDTTK